MSTDEFKEKYGFKCPIGVMGRNSDNRLYEENLGWSSKAKLIDGMRKTYPWIEQQAKSHLTTRT
jgi:GDP-D-mannose 3', 5'-epimerase